MENSRKLELLERIARRQAHVGVIGMGYVGFPLAVEFARAGFHVTGFEVSAEKIAEINGGRSYIQDVPGDLVAPLVAAKRLDATGDFACLAECDAIIICVPTPLNKTKEPDVSYIVSSAEKIEKALRPGQLVVLESTTYPGTTDEMLLPRFESTGLVLDRDFFLAFSPERVDPGNPEFQTRNITKVVGGVSEASSEVAGALYSGVVETVHRVSSARVAETAKLLENTFRAVNIGLVNEIAQLCYRLDIDTWEVIRAAATKPFGFMPFYPGPGIGGHCLVGAETAIVRSPAESGGRIERFERLFAGHAAMPSAKTFTAGGGDVIYKPDLEVLSIDMETRESGWKPVRYLYRRAYDGPIVSIATSDHRRVRVTDRHPMIVCDESDTLKEVFACDVKVGDRLPIHFNASPAADGGVEVDPRIDPTSHIPAGPENSKVRTVPVESVDISQTSEPVDVFSIEVDDTHTFATSHGIFVHNCIPLDPHYLSWKARMHGFEAKFIGLAEEVNSRMPEHVVNLVTEALNRHRKAVNGSRILILGVAYKRDIDDVRESPALSIIDQLMHRGAEIVFHDPYVSVIDLEDEHGASHNAAHAGGELRSLPLDEDELRRADCVVVVTDHKKIDYAWVLQHASLVVDTRNVTAGLITDEIADRVVRL